MFEIIHAGAGSGKTHALCEIAVQRIVAGKRPERLVATTFTRRSAAELKQRIASALLSCATLSASQRRKRVGQLEGALIGTIHSVAHALVVRHAFALGISPRIRVIDEGLASIHLRAVLGRESSKHWERLSAASRQFNIDQPEDLILRLLAAKRDNRIGDEDFRCQMSDSAQRVCEIFADGRELGSSDVFENLGQLARDAQIALENLADDTKVTEQARVDLRRLAHSPTRQWRLFPDAAKLNAGKRSGADLLLEPLRQFAANIRYERQLHDAIVGFVDAVTDETIRVDHAYAESKRASALVDFIDLERLLLRLLDLESVQPQLQSDIELVLVDEFQDVSPLQLAIFTRLRAIAESSHWVGDEKQAIYGFRGSDPALVRRHWKLSPAGAGAIECGEPQSRVRRLSKNYRTAAGLVGLCGELFSEPLGPEARQIPARGGAGRIERWIIESTNLSEELQWLSTGIAGLIKDGARAGEIAILARSNSRLVSIASHLKEQGIRSRLEQPGLLRTRECSLLMAGLRVVADRYDSLAAATVLHLLSDPEDSTPGWFTDRMDEVGREGLIGEPELREDLSGDSAEEVRTRLPWDSHPLLKHLRQIDSRVASPTAVAIEVIETLHLGQHVRRWGTPARRASHLDAVLQLAASYEETADQAGTTASLAGFIHHLEDLAEHGRDVRQSPLDSDAVSLLTYHGAKGLEFPTVVLFDLDHDRQVEPWDVSVSGGGTDEDPTAHRVLRYWPWPFGRNPRTGLLLSGTQVEQTARLSAEGLEVTQAAREESMRLLYVGFTRARDRLILAHRIDRSAWLDRLPAIDRCLPLNEIASPEGDHSNCGVPWDYRVRRLSNEVSIAEEARPAVDWFDPGKPLRRPVPRGAAWHAPSRQDGVAAVRGIQIESTGAVAIFPAVRGREEFRRVGESVHAYFAALPSLIDCTHQVRFRCAERCMEKHISTDWLSPQWLVESGERFQDWIHGRWPHCQWMCEIPFAAARREGGDWRGVADLLIETEQGEVVVVDHKSTPLRVEDCESAAASHCGQIGATCAALVGAGLRVSASYVHFPLAGRIADISRRGIATLGDR